MMWLINGGILRLQISELYIFAIATYNAIYEECVCRGKPSIGIITNSGLISHHNLGHYLL